MNYNAIIIGGGHNGLTATALLAKSGKKVLLLEKQNSLGGLANGFLQDTSCFNQKIASELQLEKYGLKFSDEEQPIFIPQINGQGLLLHRNAEKSKNEIAKYSVKDAEKYVEYRNFIEKIKKVVVNLLTEAPPKMLEIGPGDLLSLGKTALGLRMLGAKDMVEVLRILPMCIADFLNEYFENDLVKVGLVHPALLGTFCGPWSPGTTANLIFWECLSEKSVAGGSSAIIDALTKSAKENGAEIKTSTGVKEIIVKNEKVTGVILENGETIECETILSSAHPKHTFLDLISPPQLPMKLLKQINVVRTRGTTARVNLNLHSPLKFSSRPNESFEQIRISKDLDEIEHAFDAVKYDSYYESPYLNIITDGKSASILVNFAPYKEGEKNREGILNAVLNTLEKYAPGTSKNISSKEIILPIDLEKNLHVTGGNIHHGEPALDQFLFMRPSLSTARYSTPIEGLYLCGSGSHPGGGITGIPGYLGAKTTL